MGVGGGGWFSILLILIAKIFTIRTLLHSYTPFLYIKTRPYSPSKIQTLEKRQMERKFLIKIGSFLETPSQKGPKGSHTSMFHYSFRHVKKYSDYVAAF